MTVLISVVILVHLFPYLGLYDGGEHYEGGQDMSATEVI